MYRERLDEIRKEKGISCKRWSEESGVSIDTIARILRPENPDKDCPRVNTLEDLCRVLGVELWEIFYIGEKSFVAAQTELAALREEIDKLVADNIKLKVQNDELKDKVDYFKDMIINTHNYYMNREAKS
jgi:transcriptional regulator with XRE-family HTH domain